MVYCDTISAIYMTTNPIHHRRTKHIELDIHILWDKFIVRHVRVLHVPSRYQFANIFTKCLPFLLFSDFRSSLSICQPPTQTAREY